VTKAGLVVIHVDGFGEYDGTMQVNFEDKVGGHGSIGGDQLHPFVLAKREWGSSLPASPIRRSCTPCS